MSPSALDCRVDHLAKSYDRVSAVVDLSLDIAHGEIVSLLGPSGCGKTTTLRCIAGLERASQGTITIGDMLASGPGVHVEPHRRRIGLVFQSYALWPHMTVRRNVRYGLDVQHVPRAEAEARVTEALEFVDLAALERRYPAQLSGGQQQRVALARSLVVRPQLLLLDEPLSNLDEALRDRVRVELRSVLKRVGSGAVYVTHDQREALALSDRIALMNAGRLAQVGTPEELYERPTNTFVATFLGGATLIPVTDIQRDTEGFAGYTAESTRLLADSASSAHQGRGVAMVRRQHLVMGSAASQCDNRWRAKILERTYEGDAVDYILESGTQRYRAISPNPAFRVGDVIDIGAMRANTIFLPSEER